MVILNGIDLQKSYRFALKIVLKTNSTCEILCTSNS